MDADGFNAAEVSKFAASDAVAVPSEFSTPLAAKELEIQAEARERFAVFRRYMHPEMMWDWFTLEISDHLQDFYDDCMAGKRPKMVLESPPQHGKSMAVDDFIAWCAGKQPRWRSIFASYSDELGVRANSDIRRLMQTERYIATFPNTRIGMPGYQLNTGLIEYCGKRGYFRNVTVRGAVTGLGLDIGAIDDPIKGRREASSKTERDALWLWFTDDFMSRFSKNAGLLLVMTRWHIDDIVGRLVARFGKEVTVIKYRAVAEVKERNREKGEALFPDFKPLSFLMEKKKLLTESSWLALFQQSPITVGGGILPIDKLRVIPIWDTKLVRHSVRYWDKAGTEGGTGSQTAGVLMHMLNDGRFVISHVVAGRWSALEREKRIKFWANTDSKLYKNYEIRVEREPGSGGKESAENTIRNLAGFRVSEDRVTGSKEIRAAPFAAQVQGSNVWLVACEWVPSFIDECEIWPQGKLRDKIDAAGGAFNRLIAATSFNTNYSQWS